MRTIGVVVAVVLVACGPSVSSREVGLGRFVVDVEGRASTSQGEVLELLHKRASELCPWGYTVVDESSGSQVFTVNGQIGSRPQSAILIQCR